MVNADVDDGYVRVSPGQTIGDRIGAAPDRAHHVGGAVSSFLLEHYSHFNAGTLKRAAVAYKAHIAAGGQMFVSLAGAMSTGELGKSLAPMIRAGKIHGMSCTGANLEEDVFNLVGHDDYLSMPDYHGFSAGDDEALYKNNINRVTDTGIPEAAGMTTVEDACLTRWKALEKAGTSAFPHEVLYDVLLSGELKSSYQIDPANSWMLAAAEKKLPIVVPGWEDSTLGNVFAAQCLDGALTSSTIHGGIDYMVSLARWYRQASTSHPMGFFQIGGGIAGDFSICVVPLLEQDAGETDTPKWQYFCQITDADESMGGYSGALPNEKASWGKLPKNAPMFNIKSDATLCFPLIAAIVMDW